MLSRSTIQHLRFSFSIFLMPVFWFAISQAEKVNVVNAILIFLVLHVLIYPASNGYNSYMDDDKGSIGGIENPLPVSRQLLYVSVLMDLAAVIVASIVGWEITIAVIIYITASRLYSYRGIRLKRYPIAGYITVVLCQGALIYYIVSASSDQNVSYQATVTPAIISSLLIGGTYPLTQVYQHEQDRKDGVTTLSYILGIKGTFLYCGIVLLMATLLLSFYLLNTSQLKSLFLYFVVMLPVLFFFTNWFLKVNRNPMEANFKNMMRMNYVASICSNITFLGMVMINNL